MKAVGLTLGLLGVLVKAVPAQPLGDAVDTKIIDAWQSYFQPIKSLQYSATLTGWGEPQRTVDIFNSVETYLYQDGKHLVALHYPWLPGLSNSGFSLMATAYDGTHYQSVIWRDHPIYKELLRSSKPLTNDMSELNPFTFVFMFLMPRDPPRPLMFNQQEDAFWKSAKTKLVSTEQRTVDGRKLLIANFQDRSLPLPGPRFEVQLDPVSKLPVAWKQIFDQNTRVAQELTITRLVPLKLGDGELLFPATIEMKSYIDKAGKLVRMGGMRMTVDPKSLKLNEPIDNQQFSIPEDDADHVEVVGEK